MKIVRHSILSLKKRLKIKDYEFSHCFLYIKSCFDKKEPFQK